MILHLFKNNNPISIIVLPVIAILLWLTPILHPQPFIPQQIMPLYGFTVLPFLKTPFLASSIAFILILAGAFLLNYISNKSEIFSKQTFLPALFYIVLMSINTKIQVVHPILFSNLFLLLALYVLLNAYRRDAAFANAFNAGALISLSTLFYFPNIIYFPLLGFALTILRTFNWREWLISFFGVIVPFAFLLTYYFWNDQLIFFLQKIKSFVHFVPDFKNVLAAYQSVPLIVGGIVLLLSFFSIFNSLSSSSQKSKKSIFILSWFGVFSISSFFMAPENHIIYFSALAIPFSMFLTGYFLNAKKTKVSAFLLLLFIASILFQQVYSFL